MDSLIPFRRVLIENPDAAARAMQSALLRAYGLEVTSCGGPRSRGEQGCPVLQDEPHCPLVDEADVVLFDLDLDKPDEAAVLDTLRSVYPSLPVVVEIPTSKELRHAHRLEGCVTFPPHDADHLGSVVRDVAVREATGLPRQQ